MFHVGRPEGPTDNTRTNGWRDALKERGVTAPDPIIVPDDDLEESVKAGRTLGRRGDVTAIFAGNDETAIAVIRGLREVGRRVPADVSVVGFDAPPSQVEVVQGKPCLRASERAYGDGEIA